MLTKAESNSVPGVLFFQSSITASTRCNSTLLNQEIDTDDINQKLKNEFEADRQVNQDYILELIETFQDMDEDTEWDIVVDNSSSKCWLARNGSSFSRTLPFLHFHIDFSRKYAFGDIVDAVVDADKRAKWDKDIKEIRAQSNELGSMAIVYTIYQRFNILGSAFTADKQVMFSTEGENDNKIFVVYTSSLPADIVPELKGLNFIKVLF